MPFPGPKLNLEGIDKPLTVIIGGVFLNLIANDVSVELPKYSFVPSRLVPYIVLCTLAILWQILKCRLAVQPRDATRDVQRLILMDVIETRKETGKLSEEKLVESDENPRPASAHLEPSASERSSQAQVCPCASVCAGACKGGSRAVLCARSTKSGSQALVSITIHTEMGNEDVRHVDSVFHATAIFKSCKVLQKRLDVGSQAGELDLYSHVLQIAESLRRAVDIDKYCTLQLGLFALKDTDSGLKWWELEDHWTPKISSLRRSPLSLLNLLPGHGTRWTVKGFNLHKATLRVATANESEDLKIVEQYKMDSGQDKIVCREPELIRKSAPRFGGKLYVLASSSVEVEEGVTLTLKSEAQDVRRAYWISVVDGLIPSPWMLIMMASLSLWGGLAHVTYVVHDMLSELAWRSCNFQSSLHDTMDYVYFESETVLSSIWRELELHNFVFIYIFALVVRDLVSVLCQYLQGHTPSPGCDVPNHNTTATSEQTTNTPDPATSRAELGTDMCTTEHGCDGGNPTESEDISTSNSTTSPPPTSENISDISNPAIPESSRSESGSRSSGSSVGRDSSGTTLESTKTDAGPSGTNESSLDVVGTELQGQVAPIMPTVPEASIDRGKASAIRGGSKLTERSTPSTTSGGHRSLVGYRCPPHGSVAVCGRRREMEDAVASIPAFSTVPREIMECPSSHKHVESSAPLDFFGVYDGHGGSQVSLFCADRLHRALAEEINAAFHVGRSSASTPDGDRQSQWRDAMVECFSRMDAEVGGLCRRGGHCDDADGGSKCCEESNVPEADGGVCKCCKASIAPETVGSTAVIAVVGSCQIIVGNCGDSRAVLSRGGQAIALSTDHKPDRDDELARIEGAGGRVIFWNGYRVLGVLAMSRAIGDRYLKPYVIPVPEVTCTQRSDEDECLILATDGLWDVLSNDAVCEVTRKCLAERRSSNVLNMQVSGKNKTPLLVEEDVYESRASKAAALLTKLALARGSSDNISVVVVDLRARPSRGPSSNR